MDVFEGWLFYQSSYVLGELKGIEKERERQHQQKLESAKKMYQNGISIDDIALFTELDKAALKPVRHSSLIAG